MRHRRVKSRLTDRAQSVSPSNGVARNEAEERKMHNGVTLKEATRVRAYQLWEAAGRPASDGVSFWLEAEKELVAADRRNQLVTH